ncbi:MAG: glycerophosphodiester phosphodiesterase family protein [Candidatus Sericytochromatia bacterium]|nr:glycerophosphodiester phosphodiesterase family protein [Candidatus Sericytochromatia bacterium]MEB3221346.1 glycerophosphodiester phosphodiesterase family protein [Candidatus Sericytochromatia bacterium]
MGRRHALAAALVAHVALATACAPLARGGRAIGEQLVAWSGQAAPAAYHKRPLPALPRPWIVAHRGYSALAPENTLASLRAAVEAGADAVEFDVRLTRDGEAVLMHDPTVDRTTSGRGEVASLTLAELRRLDAGGWKHPRWRGEPVPTVAEALAVLAGRAVAVVELKEAHPGLVRRVAEALGSHTPPGGAILISFHRAALRRLAGLAPDRPLGLLVRPLEPPPTRALGAHADLVLSWHEALGGPVVAAAHGQGLPLFAWTVDEPAAMARLLRWGVDGLVTNEVDRAVALRRAWRAGLPMPAP